MAFQQGLSGLNVYSKALDVVSNNIANASTVGFKAAQAHFADVYAGALNGSGASQVGIGVGLAVVQQQFTQGNISVTNNALDIAINGNGFFRLQQSTLDQTGYYTRNGQFHLDKSGYIVNSNGGYLTGYNSADGVNVDTASIVPLTVGTEGIQPQQTGWSSSLDAAQGGLIMGVNLDNRDKKAASVAAGSEWTQLTPFAWDSTFNTSMYNYSTSATIYDQAGASHTLTNYYVRTGDSGAAARTWDVYTVIDNKYMVSATPTQLEFEPNGTLVGNTGDYRFELDLSATVMQDGTAMDLTSDTGLNWFAQSPGVSGDFAFYMDMGKSTHYGMAYNTDDIIQDGYTAGTLTKLSVDEKGFVVGNYSNGQTKLMGQVVLAEFNNPNGLQSMGDNLWVETFASGQPTIGTPGAGTRGKLQSGSVEESNTDLTQELVNMIVMQRNYQANAQSIKTQDQVLQTLVSLR
ncbi:flagellar hook protein FlgE [Azovibrio restrictus]|uniref:flagellar hook protein FlgE n=1 Tax=Azovibrio restrictus TaxID=146938 RepID=UPI0026EE6EA0|nr:flagellar hook protein FlgE [Azovibrio restrictus]MDD3481926.1 flagellar hook protein FlgE [Azovibrio restrictus]